MRYCRSWWLSAQWWRNLACITAHFCTASHDTLRRSHRIIGILLSSTMDHQIVSFTFMPWSLRRRSYWLYVFSLWDKVGSKFDVFYVPNFNPPLSTEPGKFTPLWTGTPHQSKQHVIMSSACIQPIVRSVEYLEPDWWSRNDPILPKTTTSCAQSGPPRILIRREQICLYDFSAISALNWRRSFLMWQSNILYRENRWMCWLTLS